MLHNINVSNFVFIKSYGVPVLINRTPQPILHKAIYMTYIFNSFYY